jgi:hypothetical protein
MISRALSKYVKFPLNTLTAPTENRTARSLIIEKSTSSSRVSSSGSLS